MSKFKYQEHIFHKQATDQHIDKFLRMIVICREHEEVSAADALYTVIVHEGHPIFNDAEGKFIYPPNRTHGGTLRVLVDQNAGQLGRRRRGIVREWHLESSEEHTGERGLISSLLKVHLGQARHESVMRSLDLMPVMTRPDGSLVLDGEEPGPGAAVVKPIDTAPKPAGWGAW